MVVTSIARRLLFFIFYNAVLATAFHWDYKHEDEWPDQCQKGKQQSPINLSRQMATETLFPSFIFEYYDEIYRAEIKNSGHTAQIQLKVAVKPKVSGGGLLSTYVLDNMHFHWNSEHTINEERFPLELHLVHYDSTKKSLAEALKVKGGVAVLAVFFYLSPDSDSEFDSLFDTLDQLNKVKLNEVKPIERLDLGDFLPRDRAGFYRYEGSLTTPNCTEGVIWTVFTNGLPISSKQLKIFSNLKTESGGNIIKNYRTLQELNDRKVQIKISPIESSTASHVAIPSVLLLYVGFFIVGDKL
ncbi:putative carbonic anhydrase 3 isoform X1 [Tribolium castaneum]|uniref:Carbonic anhydrase n=1 Tax=Tribolium castaneum TaxID=7070 RepID=D7EIC1_TRICA|nr:PREDICTED: putative carbonic anhydrase 3 isoform X1 [Tribolium castaneum]EFA11790.2 Carbonic anhydrase 9-like Protein [Tribolium castaneum]|eukprot:XP_971186.1 PREDICTED: putative carbonic anhydrase 3 isoform X1 [Tribolium castaneum]